MLSPDGCKERRRRLVAALADEEFAQATIVLFDPRSIVRYGNYFPSPFVFRTQDAAAALVVTPDGRATLIADSNVRTLAEAACVDERVLPVWYDGKHSAPRRREFWVQNLLANIPASEIATEPSYAPSGFEWALAERANFAALDLEPTLEDHRRAKDPDEVAAIETACRAAEAGFAAARAEARPGMSELDVYLLVQNACVRAAGRQALVYGDFVSGPRCEAGGGPPTDRRLEPGDLLLLDFSVVLGGYRGDFAATFAVGGPPTAEQRHLHETCLQALAAGEKLLRPGTPCREIDAACRGVAAAAGLGPAYKSHTGHGLGLAHPEPPYLVAESADALRAGDVVTLEPGLFVPGTGGVRVEHNYLIEAQGFRRLSFHSVALSA